MRSCAHENDPVLTEFVTPKGKPAEDSWPSTCAFVPLIPTF